MEQIQPSMSPARVRSLMVTIWALASLCLYASANVHFDGVKGVLEQLRPTYQKDLEEFVGFPSVSALPEHEKDIRAAAAWLVSRLETAGLQNVKVHETGGPHPVVYADWLHAPGNPTILIYGHYDVQPVDPLEEWESGPFNVTLRDGYYYGRGVDDDKGGILMAVQGLEAVMLSQAKAESPGLPVNVKVMFEGQEEVMSPHLTAFLQHNKELLAADLCLSADGGQVSETQGGIPLGLRGVVSMQIDVVTAGTDMHSGIKGGSVPNPNHVLAQIVASLHDPVSGQIRVEGYYEGVVEMTDVDKEDISKFPFSEDAELEKLGLLGVHGEQGYHTLARRWHRPTIEVVGMQGGFTGSGIKTVIPRSAFAKLACRLVPGQEPGDILAKVSAHVAKVAPSYANVTVTRLGGGAKAWTSDRDTLGNKAAAQVLEQVMGVPPVFYRDGGTIPALGILQEVLNMPTTVFGWGLGEKIHAPNERIKATMYDKGREAWARLLLLLGEQGQAASEHQELHLAEQQDEAEAQHDEL